MEAKGGLKTPHLQSKLLNQNGFSSFLLNNSIKSLPTNFSFGNVTFFGNVNLNEKKSHSPDLKRINMECVRNNGSFVIGGKKVFKDTLKIVSLITDEINSLKRNNVLTKGDPVTFTGISKYSLCISMKLEKLLFNFFLRIQSFSKSCD